MTPVYNLTEAATCAMDHDPQYKEVYVKHFIQAGSSGKDYALVFLSAFPVVARHKL